MTAQVTAVSNERKHFKRKRVNTKTPNHKSTTVIISAPQMQWNYARKLIDSFASIVEPDQIKNCDMKLVCNQIHVQLSSIEASTKLVENLNNKPFLDKLVTANYEKTQTIASPQIGPIQSSSSPPQINATLANQSYHQAINPYEQQPNLHFFN